MSKHIKRILEKKLLKKLADSKVIIVYGARQVGKSTLLRQIFTHNKAVLWLYGDQPQTQRIFEEMTPQKLKTMLGAKKILVIDEAQMIQNIGLKLKMFTDYLPKVKVKVLATGSSSFDLANKINEPLTGRKWEYELFPLSFREMAEATSVLAEVNNLETRLIYGYYPEVALNAGAEKERLLELVNSYLYKDVLIWENLQKTEKITKLLQALAFQVGSQVSYNELAGLVGLDLKTVEKYLDLLEKAFVIYRVTSYSNNLRNELKASRKIYFYDNGVRNALISAFNPLELRNDIGALWENFMMSELLKKDKYAKNFAHRWFWRTKQKQEIDLIHEADGVYKAYEFKWNAQKKVGCPEIFRTAYPETGFQVINKENFVDYI
ncbi:putative AAA family ATPase [Candidatus Termititenax aidoneus]|uniref:AAA family ATPase n=1 Tax=Termititenax aidoneus TaxID=2218524 RepID=A0A388TBE7_TERA1|nr:putative AAA family ATPase [Candidatus Termititenax aidoneus]